MATLYTIPLLRTKILPYGKLDNPGRPNASTPNVSGNVITRIIWNILEYRVPKSWFTHFYVIGSIWNGLLLGLMVLYVSDLGIENIVMVVLFETHLLRRVYEQVFVFKPKNEKNKKSAATMKLGHYVVGCSYYFVTCVGLVIDGVVERECKVVESPNDYSLFALGIGLFIYGMWQQYRHHVILGQLRSDNSKRDYTLPKSGWFQYVACPHYFAEIIIYASFAVMTGLQSFTIGLIVFWVGFNLSLVANETFQWYREKFRDECPSALKRIIPFVL